MSGLVAVVVVFLLLGLGLAGAAYWVYQRKLRRAKAIERGLKMVPILIHLPPPSSDTEAGNRDVREVMREKTAQAGVLYNMIAGTAMTGFKSRFYGQRHVALELVAIDGLVHFYAAVPVAFVSTISKAIQTAYPGARLEQVEDHNIFNQEGRLAATLGGEMVLRQTYVYPIATYEKLEKDPMEALLTTVSALEKRDGVGIQIMIRPANPTWSNKSKKMADAIRKGRAQNVSFNAMDIAKAAVKSPDEWRAVERERLGGAPDVSQLKMQEVEAMEEKTKHPAFEVLIRVLVSTQSVERSQQLLRDIATTFALFESPGLNGFKFLPALDVQGLVTAFIFRFFPPELRSNILNSVELATLFHLPDAQFTPTMSVERQRSKQVDGPVHLPTAGLLFGHNEFRGVSKEVRLAPEDRRRHSYILGQTGTGKSTMLENLAFQDMLTGSGFAFIDPHGDSAEKLLAMVPKERAEDIVYFNPSDTEYPLGLNLFEFNEPSQKDFIVQETINMLYKLYDPGKTGIIGPRYEHWYRNAALTLMSDPNGSTFIEIPKVFTDTDYLKAKFKYLRDPTVIDFWTKEMGQTSDYHKSEMLGWFVSKFGAFQNNEMMRNIIGQTKSSFNLRDIMDQKKILIVNLSKGRVGELNSQLLGMIFVIKFQAAAMSRANMPEDQRTDFCLYVDEFQNFSTDSFASILSEARKYRLNLIVANQFIGQLSEEIREAVFGNIGSIVAHRMGPEDAEFMVKQFAPVFDTNDLVNIPNYNAAMRLMIGGLPSQPFTVRDSAPLGTPNLELGLAIKQLSAAKYGHSKAKVESDIMARLSAKSSSKPAEPAAAPGDKAADSATANAAPEVQPAPPPAPSTAPPPGPGDVVPPTDDIPPAPQAAASAPPAPAPAPQPAPVVQAGPAAAPQMAQPAPAGPQPAPMPQAVINAGMHPDHQVGALQNKADAAPIPARPQQAETTHPATPGAIYSPAQAPQAAPLPRPGDAFYNQADPDDGKPEPSEANPARMPATTAIGNDPDQSMESGMADMGAPMGAPATDPQPQAAPPAPLPDPSPQVMAATPPPIGAPPVDLPMPGAAPAPAPAVPQPTYAQAPIPMSPASVQPSFSPAPVPPLEDNMNDMAATSPQEGPPAGQVSYQQPVSMQPAAVAPMPVAVPQPVAMAPTPIPVPVAPPPVQPVAPPPPPVPTAPAMASAVQAAAAAPPPIGAPPVDIPMPGAAPAPAMPYTPATPAPPMQVTAPPPQPVDPAKTLSLSDITGGQTRPPVDLTSIDLIPPGAEPPPRPQPPMQAMQSQPMAVTGRPMAPAAPPPPPMPMLGSGMALEGDPYANIDILGDLTQPGTEAPTMDAAQGPVSGPLPNDPNAGIPLTGAELGNQTVYSSSQTAAPALPKPKPEPPAPEPPKEIVAPPAPPVPPPPPPAPAPIVQAPPPVPPQPAPAPPPPPKPAPVPPPAPTPVPPPPPPPVPTTAPAPPPPPVAPPPPPVIPAPAPALPPIPPAPVAPALAPAVPAPAPQAQQGQSEDFFNSQEPLIHFVDPGAQAVLDRPDVVEPRTAPDEEDLLLAGLPEGVTITKPPVEATVGPTPTSVPLPAPPPPAPVAPVAAAPVAAPGSVTQAPAAPASAPTTAVTLPTPQVPGGEPLEKMAKEPPPIGAAPVDIGGPSKGQVAPPPPPKPEAKPEPKKEAPKPIPKSNASLAQALMTDTSEEQATPAASAPALDGLKAVSAQLDKKPEEKPAPPAPAPAKAEASPEPKLQTPAPPEPTAEAKPAETPSPKPADIVKPQAQPGPQQPGTQTVEATEEKIDDILSMSLIQPDASSGAHHRLPEPMAPMAEDDSGVDLEMNANRRQRSAGQPGQGDHPMEHHGLKVIQPTEPIVPPHDRFMKELAEMEREEAAAATAAAQQQPQKGKKGQAPAPAPSPVPAPQPAPPPPPPAPAPPPVQAPAPVPTPPPAPATQAQAAPAVIVQHKGAMLPENSAAAPVETEDFSGLPQAESLAADDVAHARAEREAAMAMQKPTPTQEQELPVVTTGKPPEQPPEPPQEEKKSDAPKAEKPKDEKKHMLRRDKPSEHTESKEEEEHNKPTAAMKEQGQMMGKLIMPTGDKPKMEDSQKMEKPKKLAAGEVFVDEHGNVVIGE